MDEVDTEPKQPEIPFEVAQQRFAECAQLELYVQSWQLRQIVWDPTADEQS